MPGENGPGENRELRPALSGRDRKTWISSPSLREGPQPRSYAIHDIKADTNI
jgi:hypothetical protein